MRGRFILEDGLTEFYEEVENPPPDSLTREIQVHDEMQSVDFLLDDIDEEGVAIYREDR